MMQFKKKNELSIFMIICNFVKSKIAKTRSKLYIKRLIVKLIYYYSKDFIESNKKGRKNQPK